MHSMNQIRSLLLNSSYEPIKVLSWQKALILWLQDKVEILDYHPFHARSPRQAFPVPSIMRLKRYVMPANYGRVRFCRENIYRRDNFTCQYCRIRFSPKHLTLDHVVPASHNGGKTWTNMVTACRSCNQKKANRTPQKANMPLMHPPKTPHWAPMLQITFEESIIPMNWLPYLKTS